MAGTEAHYHSPDATAVSGQVELPGLVAILNGRGPDTWLDTALEVALPAAGAYRLGGAVLGHLDRLSDGSVLTAVLEARLFDVAAGIAVPLSQRCIVSFAPAQGITTSGGVWHHRASAPLDVQYAVAGPATIRLQGRYTGPVSESGTTAAFMSNAALRGTTLINYTKIA